MSDRSPADNDSRVPKHWSNADLDQKLKTGIDKANAAYAHAYAIEDKQRAKAQFINGVKQLFKSRTQALYGDNHDPKYVSIVKEIAARSTAAIAHKAGDMLDASKESELHDKAKQIAEDAQSNALQIVDGIKTSVEQSQQLALHKNSLSKSANAKQKDNAEHEDEQKLVHAQTADYPLAFNQSRKAIEASILAKTIAMASIHSFKSPTAVYMAKSTIALGAGVGLAVVNKAVMTVNAVNKLQTQQSGQTNAYGQDKSTMSYLKTQLILLPLKVQRHEIVQQYGRLLLLGRDAYQIMEIVKTLDTMNRFSKLYADDVAQNNKTKLSSQIKKLSDTVSATQKSADEYVKDKSFFGRMKRWFSNVFIHKLNGMLLRRIMRKSTFIQDVLKYVLDRISSSLQLKLMSIGVGIYTLGTMLKRALNLFLRIFARTVFYFIRKIKSAIVGLINIAFRAIRLIGRMVIGGLRLIGRGISKALGYIGSKISNWFLNTKLGKLITRWKTGIKTFFTETLPKRIQLLGEKIAKPFRAIKEKIGTMLANVKTFIKDLPHKILEHISKFLTTRFNALRNTILQWSLRKGFLGTISRHLMKSSAFMKRIGGAVATAFRYVMTRRFVQNFWQWLIARFSLKGGGSILSKIGTILKGAAKVAGKALSVVGTIWLIYDIAVFITDVLDYFFPNDPQIAAIKKFFSSVDDELFNWKKDGGFVGKLGFGFLIGDYVTRREQDIANRTFEIQGPILGFLTTVNRGLNSNFTLDFSKSILPFNVQKEYFRWEYDEIQKQKKRLKDQRRAGLQWFNRLSVQQQKKEIETYLLVNIKEIKRINLLIDELEDEIDTVLSYAAPGLVRVPYECYNKAKDLLRQKHDKELYAMRLANRVGLGSYSSKAISNVEEKYRIYKANAPSTLKKAQFDEKQFEEDVAKRKALNEKFEQQSKQLANDIEAANKDMTKQLESIIDSINEIDADVDMNVGAEPDSMMVFDLDM